MTSFNQSVTIIAPSNLLISNTQYPKVADFFICGPAQPEREWSSSVEVMGRVVPSAVSKCLDLQNILLDIYSSILLRTYTQLDKAMTVNQGSEQALKAAQDLVATSKVGVMTSITGTIP